MKRFFALSRTTHALLDIAAPAFCALLWLGQFPKPATILLALCTAFAAYTAVYALNDLIGAKVDKEKFAGSGINPGYAVEASAQRYPVAQNILSMREAAVWMTLWFAIAIAGSYLLNPVIILILVLAAALEVTYCLLLKITYLRVLVSGLVKTSGPIAAVLAVDPSPPAPLLLLLFAWLFFWEIGGQNIPADWNDTVEDRRVQAKTIPIRFGFERAGLIVVAALILSVLTSSFLPLISPARLGLPYVLVSLVLGYVLLVRPGYQLYQFKEGGFAARLFDRASYYPLAQLSLITVFLVSAGLRGV